MISDSAAINTTTINGNGDQMDIDEGDTNDSDKSPLQSLDEVPIITHLKLSFTKGLVPKLSKLTKPKDIPEMPIPLQLIVVHSIKSSTSNKG